MKYDFFITYHENDEMAGRWIAAVLREERLATLLESWDFLPGDTAEEKLHHTFNTCGGVIIILSDPIIQSGFTPEAVREVLKIASANERIFFIPVLIQPCYAPGNWGSIALMNLVGVKEEEARKQLIDAATGRAGIERKPEPLQPPGKTKDDILKKREQEYNELLAKTIKHNYHMKLNLEQEIERVVEVKNERTGEMEKRKEWVWEGVELETVLRDGNDYILVNPSGMGKTTFLTYAACALLDRSKNYPFVPLFTTCIALNNREGSIATFLSERLNSFYNNPQTYLIDTEWENLCLLMDALDQAKNVDDIVSSLQLHDKYGHYKKAKIILSSRQNTADRVKERFRKIRLKLPGEDEIQHYLGEENHKKLETLIESSRELIAVPVLLEMLKTITERGHISSILVNRSGLYTEFTRILIDRERRKPRFWEHASFIRHFVDCDLEEVLEKIAFFSLADNEILEIDKKKILKYCETVEKKEALLNIGIILEFFEDREQKIVFRHQSFQAYFAARYMYYRGPDLFQMLTEDIRFFYSDVWYEVMRFYVGLEKDPEKAWKITDSIYNKRRFISKVFKKYDLDSALRFIFAFFLLSEAWVKEEKIHECNRHIKNLITTKKGYFNFFVSNANKFNRANADQRENFIGIFESLLRDKNWNVQITVFDTLGKIGTTNAIPLLRPLLRDKHKWVRKAAAEALGNIGTAKDIPLLEPLLGDKVEYVQHAATEALGKIGTAKDIALLEPLLKEKNEWVRHAATEALVNIGTAKDVAFLEPLLKDVNDSVRSAAVYALVKIATSKKDIALLEPLLRDKNEGIRSAVAYALGEIGTSKAIPLLGHLLKYEYGYVQRAAVLALGKILKSIHIPLLEPLLRDKNEWVRSAAIEALGNIGTSKDIPLLEQLLRDEDGDVRSAAAKALSNIGTSEHIPLLEPLIRDEDLYVRSAAAESLSRIGNSNHIPLLEPLLRDLCHKVRSAATKALGNIGATNHVHFLEPLFKDKDYRVRHAAAEALSNIGTTYQISLLEPLLRDEDEYVRRAAAKALGKIGTANHIPLLEPLLRDEDVYVRSAAAASLGKIGTANHIPLLESLLRDEYDYVRSAA
ncbi:MAG: HEAT repeat domain-containing protein, partial [Candidatus Aminicenantes bacterium]